MTKRTDAQQAREAIGRLSVAHAKCEHVRDGLILAAIVHHHFPLDLWTRKELQNALRRHDLDTLADELGPPSGVVEIFEGLPEETPMPLVETRGWRRLRFW